MMDPATVSVAQRQAEIAAEADRLSIRREMSALWFGLGAACGVIFTLFMLGRL